MTTEEVLQIALQHHQARRLAEAERLYRKILAREPNQFDAMHLLGLIAHQVGRHEAAVELMRRALAIHAGNPGHHCNLGEAYRALNRLDEAVAAYSAAIKLKADYPEALNGLATALMKRREFEPAAAAFAKVVKLKPTFVEGWFNLGVCRNGQCKFDEAFDAISTAIRLRPDCGEAYANFGNLLKDQGRIDDALAAYERAIALLPNEPVCHSNWVYAMHVHPRFDARAIYEAHREWNGRHAAELTAAADVRNYPSAMPDRRLRIGYVSPDFTVHPVGRFLLPLLMHHDRGRFEIVCYCGVAIPDEMTARLRSHADIWRQTAGMSDEQVAGLVRQDRIDILVDLTMHMAANRLLVFARKPAPVQVTYLAYCSTTGLDAIDYRLTDAWLDPPGSDESCYSEKSIRLPETYWCYAPPAAAPQVNSLPAQTSGQITFGCLNNFNKVSDAALEAWSLLLRDVPGSRFMLQVEEGGHRQRVIDALDRAGVDARRMRFIAYQPVPDYFRLYQEIDITLDPFPCAGGTTSCDALWMGVPVVTLAGGTAVGRSGVSILSNIGLPDLIGRSQEQYLAIAKELAGDLPKLAELRAGLRGRMLESPLTDASRFAANVEAAYGRMWRRWCESRRLRAE